MGRTRLNSTCARMLLMHKESFWAKHSMALLAL